MRRSCKPVVHSVQKDNCEVWSDQDLQEVTVGHVVGYSGFAST